MIKKVINTVNTYSLFETSRNITAAVSGGADSVSLLVCLLEIKDIYGLNITAAHFNHKLRGEESDRDERFVRSLCKQLDVPLTVRSMDIAKYAHDRKMSIELAARKARYAFFKEVSDGLVATAHTADDNLETVLLNITRGTALKGLCGIPVKRDIYIRPLIFCTRNEVENYLSEKGYTYVTDSTNTLDEYTRNKIRHNAVPVLKGINSTVAEKTADMSANLRIDADYLDTAALSEFEKRYTDNKLNIENFGLLHDAIKSRVILNFCKKCNIEVNSFHIKELNNFILHGKGEISLPGGKLLKNGNCLQNGNIISEIPDFGIEIAEKSADFLENSEIVNNLLFYNCIDCDKIVGSIKVRTRMEGDKITLPKRHVTKTLKKLFTEIKVPKVYRSVLPVIADDNGVVWVYGIGADKRVMPDKNTKNIFYIKTKKDVSVFE